MPHPNFLVDDALMVPAGEDYGGITDRHTVIPRNLVHRAVGMLYDVGRSSDDRITYCDKNPEGFLKEWYQKMDIEIRRFPRVMYGVVTSSTKQKTSWSVGQAHRDVPKGIRLKYVDEFFGAQRSSRLWSQCEKNVWWISECKSTFQFWLHGIGNTMSVVAAMMTGR